MLNPAKRLQQGRYEIVRNIGSGGMGSVYEAKDLKLGASLVAIKQTHFSGDQEMLRRAFEREGMILASLSHQALPQVKDYFIEGDSQFLVMELVPGKDLSELLAEKGKPIELSDLLTWADQLLDALDYLHTQNPPIIHRDIKPTNIKLTPRGRIILLDFGLAKEGGNKSSIAAYTINYAPPEQIRGQGTTPASDIYAIGATFYHLLTGLLPVDATGRAVAKASGDLDPIVPINKVNPKVPEIISNLIAKSMEIDSRNRVPSALLMRQALKQATKPDFSQFTTPSNNISGQTIPDTRIETSSATPQTDKKDIPSTSQPRIPNDTSSSAQKDTGNIKINFGYQESPKDNNSKILIGAIAGLLILVIALVGYMFSGNSLPTNKTTEFTPRIETSKTVPTPLFNDATKPSDITGTSKAVKLLESSTAKSDVAVNTPEPVKLPKPNVVLPQSEAELKSTALESPSPVYPPIARASHIEGDVVVEIVVSKAGSVSDLSVVSGHPLLQQSAVSAAKEWKFKPVIVEGEAIERYGRLTFRFKLN